MSSRIIATVQARLMVTFGNGDNVIVGEVTDLTADRWLESLLTEETSWPTLVADLVTHKNAILIHDALIDGVISSEEFITAAQEMLAAAGGRPWWETFSILSVAEEWWDVLGGEMAIKGIIPSQVTLGIWLDAVWLLIRRLAAGHSDQLLSDIIEAVQSRPADLGPQDGDGEMSFSEFMAAANELRGPLPGMKGSLPS